MKKKSKILLLKRAIVTSLVIVLIISFLAIGVILRDNYINNKFDLIRKNIDAKPPVVVVNPAHIDSSHLPLLLKKYELIKSKDNRIIQSAKWGGICSAGNLILGISYQGEGYFLNLDNDLIKKINFRLPNSKALLAVTTPASERALDIECHLDNKTGNIEAFITYGIIKGENAELNLSRVWLSNSQNDVKQIGDSELLYELDSGPTKIGLTQAGKIKLLKSGQLIFSGSYQLPKEVKRDGGFEPQAGQLILLNPDTKESSIISNGHRGNTQGIEETDSGEIYTTEHGPRGGDELNRIVKGANYGWPLFTHGTDYNHYGWREVENIGRHDYVNYKGPIFSWVPSIATSPLIQVRNFNSRWDGDLLIGTLKNKSLYRIRIKDDAVRFVERVEIGERIRDLTNAPGQKIVILTDVATILVLEVDKSKLELNQRVTAN
jgi:hypothetical protein